jgi:hypothetical protein
VKPECFEDITFKATAVVPVTQTIEILDLKKSEETTDKKR